MLATLIIVFREVLEAGLIAGLVLAAARGVAGRGLFVSLGILGGIAGACIVALFASSIGAAFAGAGQDVFNAAILSLAVLMLGWHNIWMARHGRELASEAKALGQAVASGQRSLMALAVVVGVAVLREGAEVVLFLYGIAQSGQSLADIALGTAVGIGLGAGAAGLIYFGLLGLPMRHLFSVTSILIALVAAGLAAQAATFLQQAGIINALYWTVWDTSGVLSDNSLLGSALQTLIGYIDRPTALQLIVYVVTLGLILGLTWALRPGSRARHSTASSAQTAS